MDTRIIQLDTLLVGTHNVHSSSAVRQLASRANLTLFTYTPSNDKLYPTDYNHDLCLISGHSLPDVVSTCYSYIHNANKAVKSAAYVI
jgi:hypothetical protein